MYRGEDLPRSQPSHKQSWKIAARHPRAQLEDTRKAATILVQFEDGTKLDTCPPIGLSKLSDYFEPAPGQILQPVVQDSPAQDKPSESTPPSEIP
jgi:hypothetical protein